MRIGSLSFSVKVKNMEVDDLIKPEALQDLKDGYTHFYIIGVRTTLEGMKPKLVMDFMIEYKAKHVQSLLLAAGMIANDMITTTHHEAFESVDMTWLSHEIYGAMMRSRANQCTTHKFKCQNPMRRKDLEMFVDSANIVDHARQQLEDSRI